MLASSKERMGMLLSRGSEAAAAERAYEEAVRLYRIVVERNPASPRDRSGLAGAIDSLGQTIGRWSRRRQAEALVHLDEARDMMSALVQDYPNQTKYRSEWSASLLRAATFRTSLGDHESASVDIEAAIEALQRLRSEHPDERIWRPLGFAHYQLARCHHARAFPELALEQLDASIEFAEELLELTPGDPTLRQQLAQAWLAMAEWELLSGEEAMDAAVMAFDEGLCFSRSSPRSRVCAVRPSIPSNSSPVDSQSSEIPTSSSRWPTPIVMPIRGSGSLS